MFFMSGRTHFEFWSYQNFKCTIWFVTIFAHLCCLHRFRVMAILVPILVLLYGSESWVVLEKDASLLRVFERKVLRAIFGPINENGVFRRRYNHELEAIYGKPDIISEIKRNRMRWFGHIIRMKESRVTKALFSKKPPFGTRSAGRRRLTWEESVENDLNRLNVKNWTLLAQDRKRWGKVLDQTLSTKWM